MNTDTPQLAFSRVRRTTSPGLPGLHRSGPPRNVVGPSGNSLPRDEIEFDVRPGGFQRWTEVAAAEPDLRVHVYIDLTDVADGALLAIAADIEV